MKNIIVSIVVILTAFMPVFSFASVKINEIAWMGNEKSSYGEWIELFNDGTTEVDLNGAGLFEASGKTLIINLTKKIGAGAYYLIERTTPSMPDPVLGMEDDIGSFGGSGLSNSGEYLVLKAADGSIIDSIDASSGWPAGDSATKQTMQRSGSSWVTATATPKAINFSVNISNSGNNSSTTETVAQTSAYSYSAHSGTSLLSEKTIKVKGNLSAGRDRVVLVGAPVKFSAIFTDESGNKLFGDNYKWSFGDTKYASGEHTAHIYDMAGEYVVVLNAFYGSQEYASRANIKAVDPDIKLDAVITSIGDSVIYITNNSSNEINVNNWQLKTKRRTLLLEADTIILPQKTLPLSQRLTNMELLEGEELTFAYPTGNAYTTIKVRNLFGRSTSKLGEVASSSVNVDKDVEKPVDNVGIELWKNELSSLKEQLEGLQKTLVANVSGSESLKTNTEKDETVSNKESVVEKVAITADNDEKIVILPNKKESIIWRFIKRMFGLQNE